MKKILPLGFSLFLFLFSFFVGTAYAAKVEPVPPPGRIPCPSVNLDKENPNFNSSRPYQASPCGGEVKALYCSNDLIFTESFEFAHWLCQPKGVTGTWTCNTNWHVDPHDLFVDLADSMFPILGNTEQVKNSQTKDDTFDDATKVNEYASWYLTGVVNKAEYGENKNTPNELINYSGPIQKIMPQVILEAQRITTIDSISGNVSQDTEDTETAPAVQPGNHNQIVACGNPQYLIFGKVVTHECYPGDGAKATPTVYRLSDWGSGDLGLTRTLSNAARTIIGNTIQYVTRAATAVGSVIESIPVVGNAIDTGVNAFRSAISRIPVVGTVVNKVVLPTVGAVIDDIGNTAWNNRKPPLPWGIDPNTGKQFTAIAYERAYLEWRGKTCAIIPLINKLVCFDDPTVTNQWADLFPYIPLAQTVDKKGVEYITGVQFHPEGSTTISHTGYKKTLNAPLYFAHTQEVKDLSEFLNKSYQPKDVKSVPVPETTEKNVCSAVNVRTNQGDNLFPDIDHGIEVHDVEYTIDTVECHEVHEKVPCSDAEKKRGKSVCWNKSLDCPGVVAIEIKTGTKTPWANEIFASTVADSGSTFRRIYPKVQIGAPVSCIADIPTVTNVTYDKDGSEPPERGNQVFSVQNHPSDGGATPDSPQLTFPHIGSVYEYFLKGIQTALRPKGYGDPNPISGTQCNNITSAVCDGQAFSALGPPASTTSQASSFFQSNIIPNLTEELMNIYAQAEQVTGVPCEILAGVHFVEGDNQMGASLQNGGSLNGSLLDSAIQAGNEIKAKVGGKINSWEKAITALSRYNGGGNSNCFWDTPYTGPCPPPEGIDDIYPVNWIDSRHLSMYLIYCTDGGQCPKPYPLFERPGALTVATELYNSGK